jgi:hypothetical protein
MPEANAANVEAEDFGLPPATPRIQVDAWQEGGRRCVAIVAQGPHGAVAHCIYNDTATSGWEVGSAVLPPSSNWHRRDSVESLAHPKAPSREDMLYLGFLDGDIGLAPLLVDVMLPPLPGTDPVTRTPRDARINPPPEGPALPGYLPHDVFGIPGTYRLGGHEYMATKTSHHNEWRSAACIRFPDVLEAFGTDRHACLARVRAILRDALSTLLEPGDKVAFEILGTRLWNARSHGFFAVPGRRGDRRRQAGALYPALSTLMHGDGETVRAIDDGRPFETPFSIKVGTLAQPHTVGELDVAKLRRLRKLPRNMELGYIVAAVAIAAQLPVDWLPRTPGGWTAATREINPFLGWARMVGATLPDLIHNRSGAWTDCGSKDVKPADASESGSDTEDTQDEARLLMSTLSGAMDMVQRFDNTLVAQVCQSLRIPERKEGDRRIAGAILLKGKSMPAVQKLETEWHEGFARQDAALPSSDSNRWPAAFPDFSAPNGLVISCLLDEAALKAEGAKGLDADDVAGLDHCVGGYGRKCYTGESVIASVGRYVGPTFERLSTVEFGSFTPVSSWKDAAMGRGLGLDIPYEDREDGPVLEVMQHFGRGNGDPAPECVEAVTTLTRAIAAGKHPLDRAAVSARGHAGYVESYDWRIPGRLEQAFEAWKEYLPRSIANEGLGSLIERVASEARFRGFHPEDASEPDGPDPDVAGPRLAP